MDGTPRPSVRWSGRILLALTLLAAGLRFYRAGAQSIWVDEAQTIKYAAIFLEYTWKHFVYNLHGAVYAALLHVWSHLFGTEEFALRSLSALIGTLTVPLFYWALVPLRRPRSALLASALLAIHPFHIWYSQELRGYVLVFLAVIVSTGFFLRALEGRDRLLFHYGVANAVGLLSNLSHLFTLASHGWAQLLRGRQGRPHWRGLALSWSVTLILLTPWMLVFWEYQLKDSRALETASIPKEERIRGESSAPLLGIPYTYYTFSVGYSLGPSLRDLKSLNREMGVSVLRAHLPIVAFAGLAFGLAAFLGMIRLWRSGPAARAWFWLAVIPVLLVYGTAVRNLKVFNPRYAAAAFPAYVLAVSEGILALGRRRSLLLGLAVLVPTGTSLANHYLDPAYGKDDARSAAAYLKRELGPEDFFFAVGSDLPLLRYYWREIRDEPNGSVSEGSNSFGPIPWPEFCDRFDRTAADHDTTLVLFLRDHWDDPEGIFRHHLEANYEVEERVVYIGAEVWTLTSEDRLQGATP